MMMMTECDVNWEGWTSEGLSHLLLGSLNVKLQKTPGECNFLPSAPHTQGLDGTLTGVVSFYSIFSRLLNQPVYTGLRTAHLLFAVSTATNLTDLIEDTLILAKSVSFVMREHGASDIFLMWSGVSLNLLPRQQKGCDVFSALDTMDNSSFLEQFKFSIDDTSLHYYLYNWMCPKMTPDKVTLHLSPITPSFSYSVLC